MLFSWTVGSSPQSQLSGPGAGGLLEDSGCHLGWKLVFGSDSAAQQTWLIRLGLLLHSFK